MNKFILFLDSLKIIPYIDTMRSYLPAILKHVNKKKPMAVQTAVRMAIGLRPEIHPTRVL
jgi:hypothetical protein